MTTNNSTMTTEETYSESISCNTLTINDVSTTSILSSTDYDTVVGDIHALVSKGYFDKALEYINVVLGNVDPDGDLMQELNLISMSLVNALFDDNEEWSSIGWNLNNNKATYTGIVADNELVVLPDYATAGAYLLCINVNTLPSGKLDIYDGDTWLASILNAGTYYQSVEIENIDTARLRIVANGVLEGDVVEIHSFSMHYIADRLYHYLIHRVSELADVNPDDYIAKDVYLKDMEIFEGELDAKIQNSDDALKSHIAETNPHKTTPADIGAAEKIHTHAYTSSSQVADLIKSALANYALVNHTHTDYVTKDESNEFLANAFTAFIGQFVSVAPMVVTHAPDGILPSRFAQTNLTIPTQIILPSTIAHNNTTSYDTIYGIVATNIESLISECPKVFSAYNDVKATIPISLYEDFSAINFRIGYHHSRKIEGYRIYTENHTPQDWAVYSSNTDFVHRITAPTYTVEEDGTTVTAHMFKEPIEVNSLSFIFSYAEEYDYPSTDWTLRIEIIYSDFTTKQFGITEDQVKFCVPDRGVNRVVTLDNIERMTISPEIVTENIPYYVYGGQEMAATDPTFYFSYYPPEYANDRRGVKVFMDKYHESMRDPAELEESYIHPSFGRLSLSTGTSGEGYSLLTAYSSSNDSWRSDGGDDKVMIQQEIDSDKVLLCGYMLNWRKQDEGFIPDTWTLTVEGYNEAGEYHTRVYDSVETFYPDYSVEDDDIVYHVKFDVPVYIKKIQLSLMTKTPGKPIALNKVYWYVSERFYSIPENTMFLGNDPVSQICLGSVVYQGEVIGWVPTNTVVGRSCVIPVNNLEKTEVWTEYTVPNPFLTTDVTVSVQNYVLEADDSSEPSAYITKIEADTITVYSENSFRYAVAIARTW